MMTAFYFMDKSVLCGNKEKFIIRSMLGEIYFVIRKYLYLALDRTLGEYVY
jgi:hypothetical protein